MPKKIVKMMMKMMMMIAVAGKGRNQME